MWSGVRLTENKWPGAVAERTLRNRKMDVGFKNRRTRVSQKSDAHPQAPRRRAAFFDLGAENDAQSVEQTHSLAARFRAVHPDTVVGDNEFSASTAHGERHTDCPAPSVRKGSLQGVDDEFAGNKDQGAAFIVGQRELGNLDGQVDPIIQPPEDLRQADDDLDQQ